MTLLTLELVALLLSAFKAPRWVSHIGVVALCTGLLNTFFGFYNAFSVLEVAGDVSPSLISGGFRTTLIGIIYGILIFVISRIIKIVQSPRM